MSMLVPAAEVMEIEIAPDAGEPGGTGRGPWSLMWRRLRRDDVFPITWRSLLGLAGRRNFTVDAGGLRALLEEHLPFREVEGAALPLHVVATGVLDGSTVRLSSGPVVEAVLASCAIPGAFAPVRIGGRELMDGAVAANTPVRTALELGATRLVVLPTGYACALETPPSRPLAIVLHAVSSVTAHQLVADLERCVAHAEIVTVPPLCPLAVSPYDFSRAGELIERAAAQTRGWLAKGGLDQPRIPGALRAHQD